MAIFDGYLDGLKPNGEGKAIPSVSTLTMKTSQRAHSWKDRPQSVSLKTKPRIDKRSTRFEGLESMMSGVATKSRKKGRKVLLTFSRGGYYIPTALLIFSR